jgi:hypothetical protein
MADKTKPEVFNTEEVLAAGFQLELPVFSPEGYPTTAIFLRKLKKLSQDIEKSFPCVFRKVVARGRMASLEVLKVETEDLAEALKAYVQVDISQEAEKLFRPVPTPLTPKLQPLIQIRNGYITRESDAARRFMTETLKEVQSIFTELAREQVYNLLEKDSLVSQLGGELYRPFASLIAATERSLAPEFHLVFESEKLIEEARNQFIVWQQLVRYCLAVVILGSLDYKKVWGTSKVVCKRGEEVKWTGVYGTAGYRLSQYVSMIATDLHTLPAYDRLLRNLEAFPRLSVFVDVSNNIANPTQFLLTQRFTQLAFEPKIWRDWCPLHPQMDPSSGVKKHFAGDRNCGPNDQGQFFPFEFQRIAPDLINSWIDPESLKREVPENADHMFARPTAQTRLQIVKNHWEVFRNQVKFDLTVDPATEKDAMRRDLELRLTAGSLQYGGAHPPHSSHRRGAEFDIVVRGILNLECKSKGQIEGGELVLGEILPSEDVTLFTDDDEGLQLISFCTKWAYPSRRITWNDKGIRKEIPIAVVALKLTQCMLLTFPSQILISSWDTLRDAYNKLTERFRELEMKQTSDKDKKAVNHLLEYLKPSAPQMRPEHPFRNGGAPSALTLNPDDAHWHHWHLTYLPSELENPPEGREQVLKWIDDHINEILAD